MTTIWDLYHLAYDEGEEAKERRLTCLRTFKALPFSEREEFLSDRHWNEAISKCREEQEHEDARWNEIRSNLGFTGGGLLFQGSFSDYVPSPFPGPLPGRTPEGAFGLGSPTGGYVPVSDLGYDCGISQGEQVSLARQEAAFRSDMVRSYGSCIPVRYSFP